MATLLPDQPKDCPYGERIAYERLGRDLPSDWVIVHSLGLPGHQTKLWGEADIVVLSTKGFFALEVKGGKVSCRDGVWMYGDPNGRHYTKREDPWSQANGSMCAVREALVRADPDFGGLLFGYGVVMPMEMFTVTGAEIDPEVLLDRREFRQNLGMYIGRLQRHWNRCYQAKHGRTPRLPTPQDVHRARSILRPDVESAFSLGSYLTGIDSQLVQLSNDQVRASRRMAANPRTVVRGRAGTGKTVIAVERARQLAASGCRVLYLCFNQLLAEHLRTAMALEPSLASVEVRHVHALYREVIGHAGLRKRLDEAGDERELFDTVFPQLFVEAAIETDLAAYDALIVDEAQDLLTTDHLDAFDLLLGSRGLNRGRWHFFLDPMQNIYGTSVQESVEARLSEAQPAFDDLYENCRNTKQVAVQASIVSGIDLALEGAPDGPACENVYYHDEASLLRQLESTVSRLIEEDVQPKDIAILSPRARPNTVLAGIEKLAGIPVVDAAAAAGSTLVFSTMHAFKGLDRQVVLAIAMDEIGNPARTMLHYAGLSRARTLLRVFLPESAKPAYVRQTEGYANRLAGRS